MLIDGGYTGKINHVNTNFLDTLLDAGYVPIVSPVATSEEFDLSECGWGQACSHVAGALKADAAIFLTDTEGLILEQLGCAQFDYSASEGSCSEDWTWNESESDGRC